ncbi:MAG: amino acid ABC transporter permease [Hyphomicrobiaceae bacterium]|nr:amino acid ABC transporter permease [Hyphomicrobiaceae bacterium]
MKLDFSALSGEPLQLLMQGLVVTLHLAAWSLLGALAIGLVFGILRWMSLRAVEPVCWLYVEFARNTPPVVQLLFWYFSASFILPDGLFRQIRDIGYEFTAAAVALAIYHGAFVAEVVRAGLNAIPKGQVEAARALGLGFLQSLRAVILPQAARITAPPLVNETVSLIKNTSLAMAIGVTEMTYQYKHIDIFFFRGVEALAVVTVIYLVLCLATAALGKLLERSLSRHVHARRDVRPALTSE